MVHAMYRFGATTLIASLLSATGGGAIAQDSLIKQEIVGTWRLAEIGGPNEAGAQGIVIFDASGNFALQMSGATDGTAKFIAYSGTYSVNEADHSLVFHIELSSVEKWNRSDQKEKIVSLTTDELKWDGPAQLGAAGTLTWRHTSGTPPFTLRGRR